jgi:hypothetical protein
MCDLIDFYLIEDNQAVTVHYFGILLLKPVLDWSSIPA